jgi:two-component system KDP operon response regulator KdpE
MEPFLLIVDDESNIRRILRITLQAHGYRIHEAATGAEAIALTHALQLDLVILDMGLPDMPGIEVLQSIRSRSTVPIIILTVRDAEQDKVYALDHGADDYVTKPFGMSELMARVRSALRHRTAGAEVQVTQMGPFTIDYERRLVERGGQPLRLTPIEYDLLRILALNLGRVVTHRQLLNQVWGDVQYETDGHYMRIYIGHLRKKIEPDPARPQYILTEPGVGYRLVAPEEE